MLPKIEELRIIVKSTNAAIVGISESNLDESVLERGIQTDDLNRNRNGRGVACYIRISVFPHEIESVFFEILLPKSKLSLIIILASSSDRVTQ